MIARFKFIKLKENFVNATAQYVALSSVETKISELQNDVLAFIEVSHFENLHYNRLKEL